MQFVKNLLIASKENKYRPHIIRRHGLALSLVLIVAIQLIYSVGVRVDGAVLGYASNINQTDLLLYTNNNRTSHGLPAFAPNSKLTTAAQNKANHMIENDYWSHIAPDGTTPWYFFDQAGYAYLVAGENLAYGFDSSLGVVNGWMISPGHRDNLLLPDYEEVGFGIANGANYQGDQNTVVVAMYGDPVSGLPPTPPAAPIVSVPPTAPQFVPEVAQAANETEPPVTSEPAKVDTGEAGSSVDPLVFLPQTQRQLTNLDILLGGTASWAMYTTVMILGMLSFAYLYRHITFINVVIARGEQALAAHPLLESSLIFVALWLLLNASYGTVL